SSPEPALPMRRAAKAKTAILCSRDQVAKRSASPSLQLPAATDRRHKPAFATALLLHRGRPCWRSEQIIRLRSYAYTARRDATRSPPGRQEWTTLLLPGRDAAVEDRIPSRNR